MANPNLLKMQNRPNRYVIQAKGKTIVYVLFNQKSDLCFVESKIEATKFTSKGLALGWCKKAESLNRNYQFSITTL